MTEGLAIELARAQMVELGVSDYLFRYRHLRILASKKKTIKGENHFFYLLASPVNVTIKSKAGTYDNNDFGINEQQHVHRGIITLENTGEEISDVKFLQVIPKTTKNNKG